MAWQEFEMSRCKGCGTFPDEWLDEDGRAVYPDPYVVHTIRCLGCVTLSDETDMAKDAGEGLSFYFARNKGTR